MVPGLMKRDSERVGRMVGDQGENWGLVFCALHFLWKGRFKSGRSEQGCFQAAWQIDWVLGGVVIDHLDNGRGLCEVTVAVAPALKVPGTLVGPVVSVSMPVLELQAH